MGQLFGINKKILAKESALGGPHPVHEGGGAPPTLVDRAWAPGLDSFASIFLLIPKLTFMEFHIIPRTCISAQK